jgi:hypothetical protein
MKIEETKGKFGFHLVGGKDEPHPTPATVQIYVRSSALSRCADLAISSHLMTAGEVDQFVDEAVAALEDIRIDATTALSAANAI